jgi:hypothetical protein
MTTPDEQAERARVDRWIASWNANQILAYDKAVAEREELDRKCEERERAQRRWLYPAGAPEGVGSQIRLR